MKRVAGNIIWLVSGAMQSTSLARGLMTSRFVADLPFSVRSSYSQNLVALLKVPPRLCHTFLPSLETVFALFQMHKLFRCEQEVI
jgi:hypothetical protein